MANQKISQFLDHDPILGSEFIPIVQPAIDPRGNRKITIDDLMLFAPIQSVNGQVGNVILDAGDIGALAPGDNISTLINDVGYITSVPTYTASNGITKVGNDFQWGGTLQSNTTVLPTTDNVETITFGSAIKKLPITHYGDMTMGDAANPSFLTVNGGMQIINAPSPTFSFVADFINNFSVLIQDTDPLNQIDAGQTFSSTEYRNFFRSNNDVNYSAFKFANSINGYLKIGRVPNAAFSTTAGYYHAYEDTGIKVNLNGTGATGDTWYQDASGFFTRLPKGASGTLLRAGASVPAWSTLTMPNTISAKGIFVANSANTLTEVVPAAGQSIRINAGNTAWEAFIPGDVVAANAQDILGQKTFANTGISIYNPSQTFKYRFTTSAILSHWDVTLPLLLSSDVFVFQDHIQSLTNKTLGAGTVFSNSPTINTGVKFTFNGDAIVAGANLGALSSDPSAPTNGDVYYNSTTLDLRSHINGQWVNITRPELVTDSAVTRTITEADRNKIIRFTNAGAITVILNSTPPIGHTVTLVKGSGSGTITLSGTLLSVDSTMTVDETAVTLYHNGSGTWMAWGALGTASGSGDMLLAGTQIVTGAKTFNNGTLLINNPTNTFSYSIVGSAIIANRTITLPLLGANDEFTMNAHAQTLTNKTINGASNTITNVSLVTGVTGVLPVVNGGTGLITAPALSVPVANTLNTYTSLAPAAGQSIKVNAGGTAWEAFTPSSGLSGLTSGRVPYANSSTTITDEAGFEYNATTNILTVDGITLGNSAVAGAKTLNVASSSTNAALVLNAKGTESISFGNSSLATLGGFFYTSSLPRLGGVEWIMPTFTTGPSITAPDFLIEGIRTTSASGTSTSGKLILRSGDGLGGNVNSGGVLITVGAKTGTGTHGNIELDSLTGNIKLTSTLTVDETLTNLVGRDSSGLLKSKTVLSGSATLDFPSTAGSTNSDLTITVTGAALNDTVVLGVPNGSVVANSCYTAWVSAADTVTVRLNNYDPTTAANPTSGTFKVTIFK